LQPVPSRPWLRKQAAPHGGIALSQFSVDPQRPWSAVARHRFGSNRQTPQISICRIRLCFDNGPRICDHTLSRMGGCVTRPGAEVVSDDTVFGSTSLISPRDWAEVDVQTTLNGVRPRSWRPQLQNSKVVSVLSCICRDLFYPLEICILQFPIFNVLFLQSTPFACCRKVMAANSFDWYGSGCKGFGCCANRS
jgi:hypothetical protein